MTSFRQVEANRRNALKSTGPKTEAGKQQSRCNAVRHGLTAETVIGALEDAEDYQAFEGAIIADYDAQSAVERELVLRLASLLWRLRRATMMETGLFEIQAEHLRGYRLLRSSSPDAFCVWLISPILPSIASAVMKQPFGAKLIRFSSRSIPSIGASRRREPAVLQTSDKPDYRNRVV
jgi:hypothetical protein